MVNRSMDEPTETTSAEAPWPDGPSPETAPSPTELVPTSLSSYERLAPRVVVYWLISGVISLAFLGALAAGAMLIFSDKLPEDPFVWVVVASAIGGTIVLWTLVSPWLAYARWRFTITSELLLMRYGIIFHEEKAIPISRLQHVDLTRGPIERLFGLATLVVFTAGTEGASFRLPGLAVRRAQELRDQILLARGDDVI